MKAKIQVVLCKCCTEIPSVLRLESLSKLASESNNVMSVMTVDAICDGKQLAPVMNDVKQKELDRAVVLACHKKDVSPTLLRAYRRAGVNEFMVELVNIREEVVLPHANEPERAQAKAEAKLRAALARSLMLQPLERQTEEMKTRNVVIIGAGVAGQAAAKEAAKAGAHTVVLEKSGKTLKVPGVVMQHSTLVGAEGYGGNLKLKIRAGEKVESLDAAALVIATGGGWTQLKGSLAKAVKDAVPLYKLNEQVQVDAPIKGPVVVVDSPDPSGKTMAVQDFAWDETLETVVELKKKHPETEIWVVFQEMRAFGLSELVYKEAADAGIKFIRYDKGGVPKADPKNPGVLSVRDFSQGEQLNIRFGTLAFASIPANPDNRLIAEVLRIPMAADGGIRRGSIQRWPVSTPRPGVFVCGSALFPKSREAAEAEGEAAGAMASAFVKRGTIEFGGVVAEVEQEKCSACLTCVRTCPYEAPFIGAAGKAEIRIQACQGCGMCVGICPSKAIELRNYTDDQIMIETRTLLGGDF
ncbi:MAG: CoB--CoM heterodisulfide reductase iron-sulfur subunit A family protein [Candidatus Thermoplasmatota archaeon]|nr:CoB--CoM heterodisulfide reductase iron-sulfur subunit A family protein [Candidatus Thermoplasmatota archaeon]